MRVFMWVCAYLIVNGLDSERQGATCPFPSVLGCCGCAITVGFGVGAGDPNLEPHAGTGGTLATELSPSSHIGFLRTNAIVTFPF